jgi:hypothetical protein
MARFASPNSSLPLGAERRSGAPITRRLCPPALNGTATSPARMAPPRAIAHPKQIQRLMGHSSVKVTFDVYVHLFAEANGGKCARFWEADHYVRREFFCSVRSRACFSVGRSRLGANPRAGVDISYNWRRGFVPGLLAQFVEIRCSPFDKLLCLLRCYAASQ